VLVELTKMEQRYDAVLAVVRDGLSVGEVAAAFGVSRQSIYRWMRRYEDDGLPALADRSHRPHACPHQLTANLEAAVLEMRRTHPAWGPLRLVDQLRRRGYKNLPSHMAIYRALLRHGAIEPKGQRKRLVTYKRWERGRPMELWQFDVVGGVLLDDGAEAKILTGIDDHSRYCICCGIMPRASGRPVCGFFVQALERHGVPEEVLTDNAKVFTNRLALKPTEVLFDKICRENGITHRLAAPRSPTTTGKIERFHRTLRTEFLRGRTFANLEIAQKNLDGWVGDYNEARPHRSLKMETPAERFSARREPSVPSLRLDTSMVDEDRSGDDWVSRIVSAVGVITVSNQAFSVGRHRAGEVVDVHVRQTTLEAWCGNELLKTVARTSTGEVRKKRAERQPKRATK
jgi:transposase InsO family protein